MNLKTCTIEQFEEFLESNKNGDEVSDLELKAAMALDQGLNLVATSALFRMQPEQLRDSLVNAIKKHVDQSYVLISLKGSNKEFKELLPKLIAELKTE